MRKVQTRILIQVHILLFPHQGAVTSKITFGSTRYPKPQVAQAHYMNADVTLACERCCVTNGYLQRLVWDVNGFLKREKKCQFYIKSTYLIALLYSLFFARVSGRFGAFSTSQRYFGVLQQQVSKLAPQANAKKVTRFLLALLF